MRITVKLFASLRSGRFERQAFDYPEGSVVGDVVRSAGIPGEEATIILVNNVHAAMERRLAEGDTVAIFPLVGGG